MKISVMLGDKPVSSKQHVLAGKTLMLGRILGGCEVRIYNRSTGTKLCKTKSNSDGNYKAYVPLSDAYTIVSIDINKNFNAVIQDNVVPK